MGWRQRGARTAAAACRRLILLPTLGRVLLILCSSKRLNMDNDIRRSGRNQPIFHFLQSFVKGVDAAAFLRVSDCAGGETGT